jgi:hypothetical protein
MSEHLERISRDPRQVSALLEMIFWLTFAKPYLVQIDPISPYCENILSDFSSLPAPAQDELLSGLPAKERENINTLSAHMPR